MAEKEIEISGILIKIDENETILDLKKELAKRPEIFIDADKMVLEKPDFSQYSFLNITNDFLNDINITNEMRIGDYLKAFEGQSLAGFNPHIIVSGLKISIRIERESKAVMIGKDATVGELRERWAARDGVSTKSVRLIAEGKLIDDDKVSVEKILSELGDNVEHHFSLVGRSTEENPSTLSLLTAVHGFFSQPRDSRTIDEENRQIAVLGQLIEELNTSPQRR